MRHRISERCAHDPERLVADRAKFQEQYRDRLIDAAKPPERTGQSAA
ncbi:MAG TPA: hypothetical protein VKA46_18030 [Gemmataceae bacterium]|nr:hypothetical protein [Gemmataceae bacterium]